MSNSIIFPGQGSQKVGMGKNFFDNFLSAREVFEEVNDSLSQDLSKIMFNGPVEELTMTENAQPAIMSVSMAIIRILEQEFKIDLSKCISYAAGHSLGEYTALSAAQSLTISEVAKLLKIRGKSMQKQVPIGKGAMAAIMGGNIESVNSIIKEIETDLVCEVANHNTFSQIVISGDSLAVDKAISCAKEKGYKAIKLNVSAPFHCSYMKNTAEELRLFFEELNFTLPKIKIINNYSAKPFESLDDLKLQLYMQTYSMVRWYETIVYMQKKEIRNFFEVGYGNTLGGMIKRIDKTLKVNNFVEPLDLENLAKELL